MLLDLSMLLTQNIIRFMRIALTYRHIWPPGGFHVGIQVRSPGQVTLDGQAVRSEQASRLDPWLVILVTWPSVPAAAISSAVKGYQPPSIRRSRKHVLPMLDPGGFTSPAASAGASGKKSRRAPIRI